MTAAETCNQACSSYALREWFDLRKVAPHVAWPSRRAACHQSGNSMHTAISGLLILFALTQVRVDQDRMRLKIFMRDHAEMVPFQSPKSRSTKRKQPSP